MPMQMSGWYQDRSRSRYPLANLTRCAQLAITAPAGLTYLAKGQLRLRDGGTGPGPRRIRVSESLCMFLGVGLGQF